MRVVNARSELIESCVTNKPVIKCYRENRYWLVIAGVANTIQEKTAHFLWLRQSIPVDHQIKRGVIALIKIVQDMVDVFGRQVAQ